MTDDGPVTGQNLETTAPMAVVRELVRAAFAAGRQYAEDEFEPGIVNVVADGNAYRFVWGGPDQ